jgi:hypothetical protein
MKGKNMRHKLFLAIVIFSLLAIVFTGCQRIKTAVYNAGNDQGFDLIKIPQRNGKAIGGRMFAANVDKMNFAEREQEIYKEISSGNISDFMRDYKIIKISATLKD